MGLTDEGLAEGERELLDGGDALLLGEGEDGVLLGVGGQDRCLAAGDGDQIVYIAQVPSGHSMRVFTEGGRRVVPHCTAVGKAIMSGFPLAEARDLLQRKGMPRHTEDTMTDPEVFVEQLRWSAEHGYAIDDGEQKLGVRCVAVAVPGVRAHLALSASGPAGRMTGNRRPRGFPTHGRRCGAGRGAVLSAARQPSHQQRTLADTRWVRSW